MRASSNRSTRASRPRAPFELVTGAFAGVAIAAAGAAVPVAKLAGAAEPSPQELSFPRVAPKEPSEALETFEVLDGFQMQLVASEPLVADPVDIAYDENGLAYVVQMSGYPHVDKAADEPFTEQTDQPVVGSVRLLKDTDGDGRYDESFLFAENLSWPAGIALYRGGAFVGATPDIWYLKDTDGDHRADIREKVFTGFRKFNVQAVMNNLRWGLDHRIYGAASGNGGTVRRPSESDEVTLRVRRRDFSFDPSSLRLSPTSGGARFGNTFDDWGNRFLCNIRNPAQHVVLPNRYLQRNPHLPVRRAIHDCAPSHDQQPVYPISKPEPWRAVRAKMRLSDRNREYPRDTFTTNYVTSSSGITIYRGSAYPEKYRGNAFLGEVAGNLFYRQTLTPDGVTFTADRPDERSEFVRSTDQWFRPVNFANAPDGTLHVLDMYREYIEHPWSVPDSIRQALDFRSGSDRGRIYRLAPPGFEHSAPPRLGDATSAELVGHLASPGVWQRTTAARLIFERQDPAAAPPLKRLLRDSGSALGRLHALWSLQGLGSLENQDILLGLGDPSPRVREHAVRLAEPRIAESDALRHRVLELSRDDDARVRFQVAFSLGEVDSKAATGALAEIARRDTDSPWVRAAVLSSVSGSADRLLGELLADPRFASRVEVFPWLNESAGIVGAENQPAQVTRVIEMAAGAPLETQLAVVAGLSQGQRRARRRSFNVTSSPQARRSLERIMETAGEIAAEGSVSPAVRVQAIELLGFRREFDAVGDRLIERLDVREPKAIQSAALDALGGYAAPRVAEVLIDRWPRLSPALHGEVIATLMSRREWTEDLLDALEEERIPAGHIPTVYRYRLLNKTTPEVQQRVESIFETSSGSRSDVIQRYRSALSMTGEPAGGRKVFRRECSACHRFGGEGHDIGPSLATVQHRSAENVLVNVLDPSRDVAPDYLEYSVLLVDGRLVTGVIADETASSITLRRPENVEQTISRSDIQQIQTTGKSIMPEGLEQNVGPEEMADLLAYLLDSQPSTQRSRDE